MKNIINEITNFQIKKIRPMFQFIKKNYKHELTGIEIGVFKGENANHILSNLKIKKLYLIDYYKPFVRSKERADYSHLKQIAMENLSGFRDKIFWIYKKSEDAVVSLAEGSCDFVYIDGNHDYKYVKKDIELYLPKIKSGGVIGGHDFRSTHIGVIRAVSEFADINDLKLYYQNSDWWFIKK